MTATLADDTRTLTLDLYQLLRQMDPARWKDELADQARLKFEEVAAALGELVSQTSSEGALAGLRLHMETVLQVIRVYLPSPELPTGQVYAAWMRFREELQPAYEAVAEALRVHSVHVPSLRPTNYLRNVFHIIGATIAVLLIELVLSPGWMTVVAGAFALSGWTMEIGRRLDGRVNALLMWVFSWVSHPHEAHRINSSTWYATALLLISLTQSQLVCAVAVAVLGLADPAAAIIGRRFGSIKLINGRSLQGTATFALVGVIVAVFVMQTWHPGLAFGTMLLIAAGAAVPAALAELFSRRVDDNLSIPITAAIGAAISLTVLGLPLS